MLATRPNVPETKNERAIYHCALSISRWRLQLSEIIKYGGVSLLVASFPAVLGNLYSNTLLYLFSYPLWVKSGEERLRERECDQMGLFALEQFSASQPRTHSLIGEEEVGRNTWSDSTSSGLAARVDWELMTFFFWNHHLYYQKTAKITNIRNSWWWQQKWGGMRE